MNVPVLTVHLHVLVISCLLLGIMLYREPPTPLGDGDGRAVARGAGPQDGASAWQRPAFGGLLNEILSLGGKMMKVISTNSVE